MHGRLFKIKETLRSIRDFVKKKKRNNLVTCNILLFNRIAFDKEGLGYKVSSFFFFLLRGKEKA